MSTVGFWQPYPDRTSHGRMSGRGMGTETASREEPSNHDEQKKKERSQNVFAADRGYDKYRNPRLRTRKAMVEASIKPFTSVARATGRKKCIKGRRSMSVKGRVRLESHGGRDEDGSWRYRWRTTDWSSREGSGDGRDSRTGRETKTKTKQ